MDKARLEEAISKYREMTVWSADLAVPDEEGNIKSLVGTPAKLMLALDQRLNDGNVEQIEALIKRLNSAEKAAHDFAVELLKIMEGVE